MSPSTVALLDNLGMIAGIVTIFMLVVLIGWALMGTSTWFGTLGQWVGILLKFVCGAVGIACAIALTLLLLYGPAYPVQGDEFWLVRWCKASLLYSRDAPDIQFIIALGFLSTVWALSQWALTEKGQVGQLKKLERKMNRSMEDRVDISSGVNFLEGFAGKFYEGTLWMWGAPALLTLLRHIWINSPFLSDYFRDNIFWVLQIQHRNTTSHLGELGPLAIFLLLGGYSFWAGMISTPIGHIAVLLLFGKRMYAEAPEGRRWIFPWPISSVHTVNCTVFNHVIETLVVISNTLLTIVITQVTFAYRVVSPYLYAGNDPESIIGGIAGRIASVASELVGQELDLSKILKKKGEIEEIASDYIDLATRKWGIDAQQVSFGTIQQPKQIQDAADAAKAAELLIAAQAAKGKAVVAYMEPIKALGVGGNEAYQGYFVDNGDIVHNINVTEVRGATEVDRVIATLKVLLDRGQNNGGGRGGRGRGGNNQGGNS